MGGSCCSVRNAREVLQDPIIQQKNEDTKENNDSQVDPKISKKPTQFEFRLSHHSFIRKMTGNIESEYKIMNPPLGKGGFGEVRKAVHKATGIKRAVKFIKRKSLDKDETNRLVNEVEILKSLDHPNIIKVLEFFEDDQHFYIVTELCTGGELFDRIVEETRLSEMEAANIMKQIFSAVYYCHKNKIVHRDLKPENILYETNSEDSPIKIIDFGTSRQFTLNEKMNQKYGTPYYIAPEVLKRHYDEKCDMWSCGVILYVLLCGYPPFNGADDKTIMEKVSIGVYSLEGSEWESVSSKAKSLVKKLLEYSPENRMTAEEAVNFPWVKNAGDPETIDKPIALNAIKNLRNFRAANKLQRAVLVFLVSYCASNEEKNKLLSLFQVLDTDGDGQLTKEELLNGLKRISQMDALTDDVEEIMKSVDANNSGVIDYSEFVMAAISRKTLFSKKRLETAFKIFDKDGSGKITTTELKTVFRTVELEERHWQSLIKDADQDGDGELSLKEFSTMMNQFK